MELNPKLTEAINNIKHDYTNGSSAIARHALDTFALAVSIYNKEEDRPLLKMIAREIAQSKPGMPALENIMNECLVRLEKLEAPFEFSMSRKRVLKIMSDATHLCTLKADLFIKQTGLENPNILTCSFSSTVFKVFKMLSDKDMKFEVLALESAWNGRSYGRMMVDQCRLHNIRAIFFPDEDINRAVKKADICLTGADCLLPDGSIVNGVPTLALARAAFENKKPFIVVAESFKSADSYQVTEGLDLVPADLITLIV